MIWLPGNGLFTARYSVSKEKARMRGASSMMPHIFLLGVTCTFSMERLFSLQRSIQLLPMPWISYTQCRIHFLEKRMQLLPCLIGENTLNGKGGGCLCLRYKRIIPLWMGFLLESLLTRFRNVWMRFRQGAPSSSIAIATGWHLYTDRLLTPALGH